MERIGSFIYNTGKGVGNGAMSAAGGATEAAQTGVDFGLFWGSRITGALDGAYLKIDKALYTLFLDTSSDDSVDLEESRKSVEGYGFGDARKHDVVLRVEVAGSDELKIAKVLSTFFALVIAGFIIAFCVIKGQANFSVVLEYGSYFTATLIVACILEGLCVTVFCIHLWNACVMWKRQMVWSRRRLYISFSSCIALGIQVVNLASSIAAFAIIEGETCYWRNHASGILGLVQWTCWNTTFLSFIMMADNSTIWRKKKSFQRFVSFGYFRSTSLKMDAPVYTHAYKLVLWLFFQVWPVLIFQSIYGFFVQGCDTSDQTNCTLNKDTTAYVSMLIVSCALYLLVYWYYSSRAAIDIESKSYAEMKLVRVIFGLQHSFVMPLFFVLMVSIILLTAINLNSCWTYVQLWLGLAPLQASAAICCIILSFFYMPISRRNTAISSFLQDFAWTESSLEKSTLARNKMLEYCSSDQLVNHPMFCAETCIRHLYLANFVYSCESNVIENNAQDVSEEPPIPIKEKPGYGKLEDAIWISDAVSHEVVSESSTDTVALLTWSSTGIWISFKGTSSSQNVKTDMNFLKTTHPPARHVDVLGDIKGIRPLQMHPRVHRGFYSSWIGEGFNDRILEKIRTFVSSHPSSSAIPININGHSLGGALATLCAFDVFTEHGDAVDITVYTFGQPRVGNRAFSIDYDNKIRKHFSVIHDQDPVVRVPKGNYKRNGHRCIVNQKGDVIISPTELEMHVLEDTGKIKDHLLEGYRKAWMSVLKQQFGAKQFVGIESGRDGATRLCSTLDLDRALMGTGLNISGLETSGEYPKSEEDVQKEGQKKKIVEDSDGAQGKCC